MVCLCLFEVHWRCKHDILWLVVRRWHQARLFLLAGNTFLQGEHVCHQESVHQGFFLGVDVKSDAMVLCIK